MTTRFIQVGVGVRGAHWARVLHENPRAELVALVDLQVERARQQAAALARPDIPCLAGLQEALAAIECDAVLLVTPPELHWTQALLAFAHGRHVLCEKPLSEDLTEAIDIVRRAEAHGLQLMVGMNHRYLPGMQQLREIVREERFGRPGYGHFLYLRNRDGRHPGLNKYPLTMKQPLLLEESIHHLDLLRYCYCDQVKTVSATTWRPSWSTYADDCCASALLEFESGLHVTYVGTWTTGWNRIEYEWRTDCPRGVILQSNFFEGLQIVELRPGLALEGRVHKRDEEAEPLTVVPYQPVEPFIGDTARLLEEFIGALQDGRPLDASGKDHLQSLGLVFACIEAAASGRRIPLRHFYRERGVPSGGL